MATPTNSSAAWVSEAVTACKNKNLFSKGNILIILDSTDYSKALLLDSNDVHRASGPLRDLLSTSKDVSAGCKSANGLIGLLRLSETSSTPEIVAIPLSIPHEVLSSMKEHLTPTEENEAAHNANEKARLKDENTQQPAPSTDWVKAYTSFFRIITNTRGHGLSKSDLVAAIPQIEGVIRIAQIYNAIPAVQSAFNDLFFGYAGNGALWESISKAPVRYMKIALALENLHIYHEAFKHLVGMSASLKAGRVYSSLPDSVQATIHRRSRELYLLTKEINQQLSCGSIMPKNSQWAVSPHNKPRTHNIVNLFRDWLSEHMTHLAKETNEEPAPNSLCFHSKSCTSFAGFYRTIAAGGDAYLSFDRVWDQALNRRYQGYTDQQEKVKQALLTLKAQASQIVAPLFPSTLQFHGRDKLDYLTCIKIESGDVPWGDEDDMDID